MSDTDWAALGYTFDGTLWRGVVPNSRAVLVVDPAAGTWHIHTPTGSTTPRPLPVAPTLADLDVMAADSRARAAEAGAVPAWDAPMMWLSYNIFIYKSI